MKITAFSYQNSMHHKTLSARHDVAVSNLSSGNIANLSQIDGGAFALSERLQNSNTINQAAMTNLQNLVSFSHAQSDTLSSASEILNRMNELAALASNGLLSDSDRMNYNKEFLELSSQLSDQATSKFSGNHLFGANSGGVSFIKESSGLDYTNKIGVASDPDTGSVFGSDAGGGNDLVDSDVIPDGDNSYASTISNFAALNSAYSGAATPAASIFRDLFGEGGGVGWLKAAEDAVVSGFGWSVTNDAYDVEIDESAAEGGTVAYVSSLVYSGTHHADVQKLVIEVNDFDPPYISADRIIAHEIVHALHAQNTYFGDITGDGKSSATWLKEGLAEFIHGGDSRVRAHLGSNPTDSEIQSLLDKIGTGNESWSDSEQYASAYLAVRFLHSEIKECGFSDGIKHMTSWMKTQFDTGKGSTASGFNAYLSNFMSSRGYSTNDEFLDAFKNGGETASYTSPIANSSGETLSLRGISSVTLSDTSSYNLSSVSLANKTLTQIASLIESVSSEKAKVGSNLSTLENQIEMLTSISLNQDAAYSKLTSSDLAEETTELSKVNIGMNFYLTAQIQAQNISRNVLSILFN